MSANSDNDSDGIYECAACKCGTNSDEGCTICGTRLCSDCISSGTYLLWECVPVSLKCAGCGEYICGHCNVFCYPCADDPDANTSVGADADNPIKPWCENCAPA